MNKIFSTIIDLIRQAMLLLTVVFIFVPIPNMVLQTLIIINIVFSVFMFLSRFFPITAFACYFLRLVMFLSIYTCSLAISTTRAFLSIKTLDNHMPIVLIIGQWICRENYVCGFFTTLMFFAVLIVFCKMYLNRVQKESSCPSLSRIRHENFSIEQQLQRKLISEYEVKKQKSMLQDKVNYFESINESSKFLLGTIIAFVCVFFIAVFGGIVVGILILNMNWKDAFNQYIMLSSGYLVLFVIPLFLTSLGFKITQME